MLVNGRRIADYPQSYGGNSNFTDISNIPVTLIDRVEILSRQRVGGLRFGCDLRRHQLHPEDRRPTARPSISASATRSTAAAARSACTIFSGWSSGDFDSVFGVELLNQKPLWAYQRSFTDSRLDSPADPSRIAASPVFVIMDEDENYIDPGAATCNALSWLDHGYGRVSSTAATTASSAAAIRDVGYGTLENGREAANFWGSATYRLTIAR